MRVRPRTDADVDACVELAAVVRALDGYPVWLNGDLREFLVSSDALGAWVAEDDDGAVAGHVTLHADGPRVTIERAGAVTGLPADRLGVVARLLVAPARRRRGVGRALLAAAAEEAERRGLRPVLDVVAGSAAAIALYESCGWQPAGAGEYHLPDGSSLPCLVYVRASRR